MMKNNFIEEEIKFLADRMLGKLMKWLRILGYDTAYPSLDDLSLILMARQENRILLTRDTNLIKRRNICDFLFIKSDRWEEQLLEVIMGLKLKIDFDSKIFSRCSLCNTPTKDIDKKEVKTHVPPYVFLTQGKFVYCPSCKKYYWRGTHWQRMVKKIKKLSLNEVGNDS
ncbi:MAG TPA: Mut7-C RNAse domain-containing protein [Atribacterota bacterium]|nr:Mut7-C RNAse domain-containing protein [Atribacterota bacterium]